MSRRFSLALVCSSALVVTACGRSSSGGGTDATSMEVEALRHELFAAGVQPLPAPPVVSDELFALGQALFFDKILSGNQDVSCATCHLPGFATSDGRTLSDGVHGVGFGPTRGGGVMIPRNSPSLFSLNQRDELFWDGRLRQFSGFLFLPDAVQLSDEMRATFSPGLELMAAQAMLPPVSREEMRGMAGDNPLGDLGDGYNSNGGSPSNTQQVWEELNERLLDEPVYVDMLRAAYPGVRDRDFTFAHAGNAIAAFEARAFARTDTPLDRFVRGDDTAMTRAQVRGGLVFYGVGCANCHSGSTLSDMQFHNTGLPQLGPGVSGTANAVIPGSDVGRENATGRIEDRFQFRTPSLLNVELTGPWGHAGQFAELRDFVAHYLHPESSNRFYDIDSNVVDPFLVTMLVDNSDYVLATVDPLLPAVNSFSVDEVVDFLTALTAHDADLSDIVPASVPSGLPVF